MSCLAALRFIFAELLALAINAGIILAMLALLSAL